MPCPAIAATAWQVPSQHVHKFANVTRSLSASGWTQTGSHATGLTSRTASRNIHGFQPPLATISACMAKECKGCLADLPLLLD